MAMLAQSTSAARNYRRRQREILDALSALRSLVDEHARMACHEPDNWGFVGELGFVHSRLDDISQFLRGRT